MSSATRIFAQRSSSALRTLARRQAPVCARPAAPFSPMTRRGYASAHGAAEKSSDTPWLISAVGVTGVGLAFLLSGSSSPSEAHGHKSADAAHHEESKQEEKGSESSRSSDESQKQQEEGQEGSKSEDKSEDKGESDGDEKPKGAADPSNPEKASQSGQNVPPPSGDNADLATKWDEKKKGQEEFKETTRAGETRVATSSSTTPSKKTQSEDPREDPKKGEGEATQKGGPKDE